MGKVVVTGANGFIGTALCNELISRGHKVFAVVRERKPTGSTCEQLAGASLIRCDINNYNDLTKYILDRDIDIFYHLAWAGTSGQLRGDVHRQMDNVRGTCDAVKAASELGCARFVFPSSIMEYEAWEIMESASNIPMPGFVYSAAKISADYMGRAIASQYNLSYIRALVSNIYGPGENSERLINTSLKRLLRKEHCSFSAGDQMYDFVYIDDAIRAFAAIGDSGKDGKTYYVGSGHPKPLKEFLKILGVYSGFPSGIGLGEMPFNGISLDYSSFDMDAVQRDTGFAVNVSFEEGIKRTVAWMEAGMDEQF